MKNLNCLNKHKYLIGPNLHKNLFEANNKTYFNKKMTKDIPGIYIINFRVLNRDKKILVYNYIYYRLDFCESLILYLLLRNINRNTSLNEWARRIFIVVK